MGVALHVLGGASHTLQGKHTPMGVRTFKWVAAPSQGIPFQSKTMIPWVRGQKGARPWSHMYQWYVYNEPSLQLLPLPDATSRRGHELLPTQGCSPPLCAKGQGPLFGPSEIRKDDPRSC